MIDSQKFKTGFIVVRPKLTLFFGAGASAPFGLPVMRESVKKLKRLVDEKVMSLHGGWEILKKYIDNFIKFEHFTFEELMEIIQCIIGIEYLHRISGVPLSRFLPVNGEQIKKEIEKAKDADRILKEFIYKTYSRNIGLSEIREIYDPFFNIFLSKKVKFELNWIFTTNYDRVLEKYLKSKFGNRFYDGFNKEKENWEGFYNYNEYPIILAKLHGSIDWVMDLESGDIKKTPPTLMPVKPDLAKEIILYPYKKTTVTAQPFLSLFNFFSRALDESSIFVFVGYSFNDDTITEMVKYSLSKKNRNLKIIIIDPNAENIKERVFSDVRNSEFVFAVQKKIEEFQDKDFELIYYS